MSVLAALYGDLLEGFKIFGIVKETGVDDQGLAAFQKQYFDYPLYCDKSYTFYHALGDRKLGMKSLFQPRSLASFVCDTWSQMTSKQTEGNSGKGEGLVQGGIIFFGADGKAKCAYEEDTGVDLRVADIITAVNVIRNSARRSATEHRGCVPAAK